MNEPTITLSGNLTGDPELRYTSTGRPVARFVVAVNPRHRDAGGAWVEDTPSFWTCQAWGPIAEHVVESLRRGDRVTVTGHVRASTWTPSEGEHAGVEQRRLDVIVDEIGVSLRFTTARPDRAPRRGTEHGHQDPDPHGQRDGQAQPHPSHRDRRPATPAY